MRLSLPIFLALVIAAFPFCGQAADGKPQVQGRDFVLVLPPNWISTGVREQNQWSFISKKPAASLVVSERLVSVAKGQLYSYAASVIRARKQLEREARGGSPVIFYEDSVKTNSDDSFSELSYFGKDEVRNEYIYFIGHLSQFRLHSFWVSVQTSDETAAKAVLTNVLEGLRKKAP